MAVDGVNNAPGTVRSDWDSLGISITKNALPVAALALSVYYIFNKVNESIQWAADQREYRQDATTRHQLINAVLILGSAVLLAFTVIQAIGGKIATAVAGTYAGGIVAGVAVLVGLNYWVYRQYASHDGSPVKA